MRIAVCDDDPKDLQSLLRDLTHYLKRHACSPEVVSFDSADALRAASAKSPFDLYLLDVLLGAESGVEFVRALRATGVDAPVVFFSSSCEYAYAAFGVDAVGYVGKPWTPESFMRVLDKALAVANDEARRYLTFGSSGNVRRVRAADIAYVGPAVTVNYARLYFIDGTTFDVRSSLQAFAETYRDRVDLVPIGRSLLVNPHQVSRLYDTEVEFFGNFRVTIPRSAVRALSVAVLKSF